MIDWDKVEERLEGYFKDTPFYNFKIMRDRDIKYFMDYIEDLIEKENGELKKKLEDL